MRAPVHFAHNDHHISACGLWDRICSEGRLGTDDPAKVTCEVCMRSPAFRKEKRLHPPEKA